VFLEPVFADAAWLLFWGLAVPARKRIAVATQQPSRLLLSLENHKNRGPHSFYPIRVLLFENPLESQVLDAGVVAFGIVVVVAAASAVGRTVIPVHRKVATDALVRVLLLLLIVVAIQATDSIDDFSEDEVLVRAAHVHVVPFLFGGSRDFEDVVL